MESKKSSQKHSFFTSRKGASKRAAAPLTESPTLSPKMLSLSAASVGGHPSSLFLKECQLLANPHGGASTGPMGYTLAASEVAGEQTPDSALTLLGSQRLLFPLLLRKHRHNNIINPWDWGTPYPESGPSVGESTTNRCHCKPPLSQPALLSRPNK